MVSFCHLSVLIAQNGWSNTSVEFQQQLATILSNVHVFQCGSIHITWEAGILGPQFILTNFVNFSESHNLFVSMQALDSFISPIPRFEANIWIPVIPISTRSPNGESVIDPSGASAGTLKTQTNKWKAVANLTPQN
jgi:hypothetical protein